MGQPLPQLRFGPTLDGVLDLAYPLDNLVTYAEPRASETVQYPSAVEDSWYHGTDYCLEGDARWLPVGGPLNPGYQLTQPFSVWEQFLAWGRQRGAAVRYIPDRTFPTNYVDGWLAEPLSTGPGGTEHGGEYKLRLKLRSASRHYGIAQRGLFYEYAPGGSLSDPIVHTFSRASVGYYIGPDGYLRQDASGVLSDRHYASGVQTALLHQAVANDITNPEDLSNGTWTKGNATITANNAKAPDQNVTADLLKENVDVGLQHEVHGNFYTITSADTCTALVFVRDAGRFKGLFRLTDVGGTNSFGVTYDLHAGTVAANTSGAGAVAASKIVALAGGWYMLWIRGAVNGGVTSVTGQVWMFDASGNLTYNGDGASGTYVWGMTAVHGAGNLVATYTPTTRGLDALTVPYTQAPQAVWWYVKIVEAGARLVPGTAKSPRVWELGGSSAGFTPPCLTLFNNGINNGGLYGFLLHQTGGDVQSVMGAAPALGDTVELLGLVYADGSVELRQSINGAAETTGGRTAAPATGMPAAWSAPTVLAYGDDALHVGSQATATDLAVLRHGPGTAINTLPLARAA